jgi:hypothetical protein
MSSFKRSKNVSRLGNFALFFMEQAPKELKSIVEFLNKQMNLSEILLVEARQYGGAGIKVVVPRLFGFSEPAYVTRQRAAVDGEHQPVATDWEGFVTDARRKGLQDPDISLIRNLYDACKNLGADIAWGAEPRLLRSVPNGRLYVPAAPLSVYSNESSTYTSVPCKNPRLQSLSATSSPICLTSANRFACHLVI